MPEVSVVVVSYNTRELLQRCLASLSGCEVIVVDNASHDGSSEMVAADFPHVELIRNQENRGFGAANNQGVQVATKPLVLFLNSDAYAVEGSVEQLEEVFTDTTVAAAGGKLLNLDGSLQESCANELTLWAVFCEQLYLEKLFPASRVFSPYWTSRRLVQSSLGEAQMHGVAQVMGACLMYRKQELFDERFFLYCEDTELCHRLRKHGRILYVPQAPFYHELGSSSNPARWTAVARYNRGKELYFRIHKGAVAAFVCFLIDRLGALLRFIVWGAAAVFTLGTKPRLTRQAAAFFRVLTSPLAGPPGPSRKRP